MLGLIVLTVAFVAFGLFISLAYRRQWHWTGLPAPPAEDDGGNRRSAKTLWDWLQLLGIPVALAALAFLLNDAQTRRDQRREDQRAAQQRTIAADAERENTLRAYLAQMSELMLHNDLLRSKPGADVRNVARTATLTAVRRLDGPRRGLVVLFLSEARLLRRHKGSSAPSPVIVASADLSGAELHEAYLKGSDLHGADLRRANLSSAILNRANLSGVSLLRANLHYAEIRGADLAGANLSEADLDGAGFRGANLSEAYLRGADLRYASLHNADLRGARLRGADLRGANLRGADLALAELNRADLRGADLSGANLGGAEDFGADISGADLRGARGGELAGTHGTPAHRP